MANSLRMILPHATCDKPWSPHATAKDPDIPTARYWDRIAGERTDRFRIPVWRAYCDELQRSWLRQAAAPQTFRRTLKTDLFEEAQGDGLASFLGESSEQLLGIDISPRVVAQALQRHPGITGEVADVRRLPYTSGSIDRIVSISTLDHFRQPSELQDALTELVRVLAPSGHLFLTLDNPWNPMVAMRGLLPAFAFGRSALLPYHVGPTLAAVDLQGALEARGLVIQQTQHQMHLPRIFGLHLCRMLDPSWNVSVRWLRCMLAFERLGRWPTAPFTGHFVAIHARRPE